MNRRPDELETRTVNENPVIVNYNMIKYKQNVVKYNSMILLRIYLNKIIS